MFQLKSISKILVSFILLNVLIKPFQANCQTIITETAHNGIMDLRNVDFNKEIVSLKGVWGFYWKKLINPNDSQIKPSGFVEFPNLWKDTKLKGINLQAEGYASYVLTVLLPKYKKPLALEISDTYSSYRLFINGRLYAEAGSPDTSLKKIVPKFLIQTVSIINTFDTLNLVLQIANFEHSKGGPYKGILLGDKVSLFSKRNMESAFDLVLTGCFFMGGIFFIGLFLFGRQDKSILYFALFSIVYCYRIIGARTYVLHSLFPNIPWTITLHLEYLALFISIGLFSEYTRALYPKECNKFIMSLQLWICLLLSGMVILFRPHFFTQLINPFLFVMFFMILNILYIYGKAIQHNRVGAKYALMSTGVLIIIIVITILQFFKILQAQNFIFFTGHITFFFFQSLILSFRYTHALKKATYEVEEKSKAIEESRMALQESYDKLKLTQSQLIQSEKMASLGELTAGIAHEIQNPLNFINNFSEVNSELIKEMKIEINNGNYNEVKDLANDLDENEKKINHHGKRADSIVKGMLLHSKNNSGQKELTNLNFLAEESLRLSYHGLRAKDKSFNANYTSNLAPDLPKINVVSQDISRVLLNLFNNAFYSVNEKRKLSIYKYEPAVKLITELIEGDIKITVIDNGTGIPKKILDKIFQPFFTTKPTGVGTGLGLSLSYDIITKTHRGEVIVESEDGEGSIFKILLPLDKKG